jgi:hypothetical protein
MLGRHARPCESFLVCIGDSELCFSWSFCACFRGFVLGRAHGSGVGPSSPVVRRPQGQLPFASTASMLGQGTLLGLYGRHTTRACTTRRPATRGVDGQRHSHGLVLGCAGHHRASVRPSLTARSTQPSGTQRRGARRRDSATLPPASKSRCEGRLTGAMLSDGEHKDTHCQGATNRHGRLHAWLS